jgi:hypothetical protein
MQSCNSGAYITTEKEFFAEVRVEQYNIYLICMNIHSRIL